MAKLSRVIGIRPYSFKPQDRDGILEGYTVWLADKVKDCFGLIPYKVSISKNRFFDLLEIAEVSDVNELVGCELGLSYDRYGKVDYFEVVRK